MGVVLGACTVLVSASFGALMYHVARVGIPKFTARKKLVEVSQEPQSAPVYLPSFSDFPPPEVRDAVPPGPAFEAQDEEALREWERLNERIAKHMAVGDDAAWMEA